MTTAVPKVLAIAGVDPSGGAGLLADIKTFSALGAYGCGVVAALTAQNTRGVAGVHTPPTDFLRLQLDTLLSDVKVDAVKLGMLASAEGVRVVAERLAHFAVPFVVCDPVMLSTSGEALLAKSGVAMLKEALLPQVFMLTPNLPEAGVLLEQRPPDTVKEMYRAAERLRELLPHSSARWVLLKGGHLPGSEVVDLLFDGDRMIELPVPRLDTKNTHGTGCALSSAVAALLPQRAGGFHYVEAAVRDARLYLLGAIAAADTLQVGHGSGPIHHFHAWWPCTA
jgi:hydroxymethylpyrimidine/phosphomethylpyrimidine kinase